MIAAIITDDTLTMHIFTHGHRQDRQRHDEPKRLCKRSRSQEQSSAKSLTGSSGSSRGIRQSTDEPRLLAAFAALNRISRAHHNHLLLRDVDTVIYSRYVLLSPSTIIIALPSPARRHMRSRGYQCGVRRPSSRIGTRLSTGVGGTCAGLPWSVAPNF